MTKVKDYEKMADSIRGYLLQNDPKLDLDQIDILAKIDPTLNLKENKKLFAQNLGFNRNQMGVGYKPGSQQWFEQQSTKKEKKVANELDCDFMYDNCVNNCNNNACRSFINSKCPGEVTPCPKDRYTKSARRKTAVRYGDCDVVAYIVRAHERPPQHNCRNCQPVMVREYTVNTHKRLCRRPGYG